jgi:uncharacterized protein YjbI with pentapeptide repeats
MAANFVGANLANVNFSNAHMAGSKFNDANLKGVDFTGADLKGVILPNNKEYQFGDDLVTQFGVAANP